MCVTETRACRIIVPSPSAAGDDRKLRPPIHHQFEQMVEQNVKPAAS